MSVRTFFWGGITFSLSLNSALGLGSELVSEVPVPIVPFVMPLPPHVSSSCDGLPFRNASTSVPVLEFSPAIIALTNGTTFQPARMDDCNRSNSIAKFLPVLSFDETFEWYSEALETHPFTTKSATAAIMGATGDVLAQAVEAWTVGTSFGSLDGRRTFSLGMEGFFISGPFMHVGYELLEQYFPVFEEAEEGIDDTYLYYYKWFMVICQVLVDALIMDSFFVATTILSSGILEGRGLAIFQELTQAYIPACKASYLSSLIWSPVQLMAFKYVPLPFRVAAINLQDIAWFATISYMAHRCRHEKKSDQESTKETKKVTSE